MSARRTHRLLILALALGSAVSSVAFAAKPDKATQL